METEGQNSGKSRTSKIRNILQSQDKTNAEVTSYWRKKLLWRSYLEGSQVKQSVCVWSPVRYFVMNKINLVNTISFMKTFKTGVSCASAYE